MKIALIVPGGVDRSLKERVIPHILWLIEQLSIEHEVLVISLLQYNEPCDYKLLGAHVYDLGRIHEEWRKYDDPSNAIKNIYERTLEILQLNGPWDVIHGFWGFQCGWLAVNSAKQLSTPSVVSLMGAEFMCLPEINYGGQYKKHLKILLDETTRNASYISVASNFMKKMTEQYGLTAGLIPFGVHDSCFKPNNSPEQPPWKLLHVASINRIKDQSTLLKAFRRVVNRIPAVHLDIVGEDTLNGELQNLTHELGLKSHVTFHGFLPNNEVRTLYQSANIYLVSSLNETGPISMLEAAACRVPTVGTEVGYVADWADKRALATEIGNDEEFAEKVIFLLQNNGKRKELGEAAYNWVREYDARWTTNKLLETYKSLVY